ncbi:hypothetical protein PH210_06025 [Paenibacillus sp. BSR1-1]|uniref:hypothetical protein n=1 Tax=Paenibacillus sp. BSR1-1 TaxID=3020845 RepID=UPI0025B0EA27|nr:hypothetical protein [Paenibacillus sp. BSR1-1]MDN3015763.1 hypothetical protein [Paenibacillus sp. BSR1-1]
MSSSRNRFQVNPNPREGCCSSSRLRTPGIKPTSTPGRYFADADLVCAGDCTGIDSLIGYVWTLQRISGDVRIEGPTFKTGDNTVLVAGHGEFVLTVVVFFHCQLPLFRVPIVRLTRGYATCRREAAVRFSQ